MWPRPVITCLVIALQQDRCTPLDSNLYSVAKFTSIDIIIIRTALPCHHPTMMQQNQQLTNELLLQQRRDSMLREHDRNASPEFPALHAGQRVGILNK